VSAPRGALVSVVVPTYNRSRLVTRAIDSVLAQTWPDVEVIVVDDGSTDDTTARLQTYRSRSNVRIVRHPANLGATAAKNTGLDAVRGAFATILDSDDELLPEAIERLMAVLERLGSEVGMAFANCVDPDTGEWTGKGLVESGYVTFRDAVTARFRGEFWGIWRSSALGDRRFDPRLPGGSESIVWHDMYRTTRVYYLHEALRRYYRGSTDSVSRMNLDPANLERVRLMYEMYLERFGEDLAALDGGAYAKHVQAIALWHILAGDRLSGIGRLIESVRRSPAPREIARACAMAVAPRALLRRMLERRRSR
jgi:glycosyltransferase involved in cell wall biosynthesis